MTIELKKILSTILLTLASVSILLADAKITFSRTTHDFGTFNENEGSVTTKFEFTNDGDSPLLITRATASCGCTSPEHPKKPLRPGEKGEITVTYFAKGRPGVFDKSVYVYTNDPSNDRIMLTITGNVISANGARESFTEVLGGGLRLKTTTLNFFDVYPTRENRTRVLACYNEGTTPMSFAFRNLPPHITIETEPTMIDPKSDGRILVTYHADKVQDWGPRTDQFDILVKGMETRMSKNRITVMADIWEDFTSITDEQRQKAPAIALSVSRLSYSNRVQKPVTNMITITNEGKQKLTIRKVINEEADVFVTQLEKKELRPGESTKLQVTYHPEKMKKNSVDYNITIISNDPTNSRVIVNMKAAK